MKNGLFWKGGSVRALGIKCGSHAFYVYPAGFRDGRTVSPLEKRGCQIFLAGFMALLRFCQKKRPNPLAGFGLFHIELNED